MLLVVKPTASGNITGTGTIKSTDTTGSLTLNGGALQTIAAAIGTSAADQLSVLTIGSNGATFQIQRH